MAAKDRVRYGGTVLELPPWVHVTTRFDGYQTSNMRTGSGDGGRLLGRQLGDGASPAQGRWLRICVGLQSSKARCWIRGPRGAPCTDPVRREAIGKVKSDKSPDTERAVARCRVRESLKTVADGSIVSSDPPP